MCVTCFRASAANVVDKETKMNKKISDASIEGCVFSTLLCVYNIRQARLTSLHARCSKRDPKKVL